jgi:hypothetical protein
MEDVMTRTFCILLIAAVIAPAAAKAQAAPPINEAPLVQPMKLSGPRAGITFLSPGIQRKVEEVTGESVMPFITQFGWQWETRLYAGDGGMTGVSEWIFLVGGLEQSHLLPSLTWLVGVRSGGGTEFGAGPNLTAAGAALAVGGGATLRSGALFIPINFAAVPSRSGLRVSMLTGFNSRRGG